MARLNLSFFGLCHSKNRLSQCLIIFGIIFITYIFVHKIDFNAAVVRTRDYLGPIVPPVSITNTNNTPAMKIEKLVETSTVTTSTVTTSTVTISTVATSTVKNQSNDTGIIEQPKEAFVTFSNNQPSYLAVLKVLLDSVHAFSTRPIIAFGIDIDLDLHFDVKQYPRLIKRRIKQSDCGPVRSNSMIPIKIHLF